MHSAFCIYHAPLSLCVVLNQQKVVTPADVCKGIAKGKASIEVYRNHGPCAWRDGLFYAADVKVQVLPRRLNENRFEAAEGDSIDGGNKRIGRNDDLVSVTQRA